jgi:hypothetical protein
MFHTDRNAFDHARRLVEEALAVLMRGTTPPDQPGTRYQIAIRQRAHVLSDNAQQFGMDADLTAALWEVAIGEEERVPNELRRHYQSQRDPVHFVESPERAQLRGAVPVIGRPRAGGATSTCFDGGRLSAAGLGPEHQARPSRSRGWSRSCRTDDQLASESSLEISAYAHG